MRRVSKNGKIDFSELTKLRTISPLTLWGGSTELRVNQVFLEIEYISLYLETKIICVTLKILERDLDK